MRIVIVGDGKVGFALAEQLSEENHDIVVIDSNPKVLQEVLNSLDVMVVNGNGASLEVQREADVGASDLLIAATSSDEINLLCCILAKKLGCRHTIARIRNKDYTQQLVFLRSELGLSLTINPELYAAREIFRIIQFPSFLKLDSFAKGRVELVEFALSPDSRFVGKRLDQLEDVLKVKILVCAVERNDKVTIPKGGFSFEVGDKVTVTAPRSELARLVARLNIAKQKIRNVLIVGGGRITVFLTEELLRSGVNVKIIEQNAERCDELAAKLDGAIIINGDGTRQELLLEEGIMEMDAVISLTSIDEENLIVSMFANHLGIPKTITKIDRSEYIHLFNDRGIGSIICPKQLTTHEIIRYVRAMENTKGGSVLTLHRIVDDKAEALEFIAATKTHYLNVPLSKLKLKDNILIACINRMGQVIIPKGSDFISEGDTVIVVTTVDRKINDLDDIFEPVY